MVAIDIYLRGCQPILSLMSMPLPTDFTPCKCKAKETTVNRIWAIRCILCSRSRLMAMSCRVIQATAKDYPSLTATHSVLALSPTLLLAALWLVPLMTHTSAQCLDTACKHSFLHIHTFFEFGFVDLFKCFLKCNHIILFNPTLPSDTKQIYPTYISHFFELLFIFARLTCPQPLNPSYHILHCILQTAYFPDHLFSMFSVINIFFYLSIHICKVIPHFYLL